MAALIAIPAADIGVDGHLLDVPLPQRWLARTLADTEVRPGGGDEQQPAGALRGRLSRSGHDIVVRARVTVAVEMPCVRCLEPARLQIEAELSLLLEPSARGGRSKGPRHSDRGSRTRETAAARELTAADAARDVYDGEMVVLDDFVREAILLEVPSFPLCTESCRGITPTVLDGGPAERIDPRLAPLGDFGEQTKQPATIEALVRAATARSAALGRKPVLHSHRQGPGRKKRQKK